MSFAIATCCLSSSFSNSMVTKGKFVQWEQGRSFGSWRIHHGRRVSVVTMFVFDPKQKPILREALKEPVAFMGGMFAGLLRLDLNENPLKEWVIRTVEASGFTEEEIVKNNTQQPQQEDEEVCEQIEIE